MMDLINNGKKLEKIESAVRASVDALSHSHLAFGGDD
jgi:hypothetical protein